MNAKAITAKIVVNGKVVFDGEITTVNVDFSQQNGNVNNISGNVFASNVQSSQGAKVVIEGLVAGDLTVKNGDVECSGDIHAGVNCDDLTCKNITGDVTASGDVECEDISGNVTAGGEVAGKAIGGNVTADGDVECGNVRGNIRAEGDVQAKSVTGNINM